MEAYRDLNKMIGKYRCVSLNAYDHCLSGPLGEIWEADSTLGIMKACFTNGGGGEKIISFKIKDLDKWVMKLKIPLHPRDQIWWANTPNARLRGLCEN